MKSKITLGFELKEPQRKNKGKGLDSFKPTLIICVLRNGGERMKLSINKKINPYHWVDNPAYKRKKNPSSVKYKADENVLTFQREAKEINELLSSIYDSFESSIEKSLMAYGRAPTLSELKLYITNECFKGIENFETEKTPTIIGLFDKYIKTKEGEIAPSSIQKYVQAKENFKEFEKIINRKDIKADVFNLDLRNEFRDYLIENKSYATATILRKFKFLKTVCNFGKDLGFPIHPNINSSNFLPPDSHVLKLVLSKDELTEMENLDLSGNLKLEKTRDMFLMLCYTGQRYSDLYKININNITDDKYIKYQQQKTKEPITIRIFGNVRMLLEKYNYKLPYISGANFNKYLKEVGELCPLLHRDFSITEKQLEGNNKSGKRSLKVIKKTSVKRYAALTSHTGRRTFVTILLSMGVSESDITSATGHTTAKSLMTYNKMSGEQKADLLYNSIEGGPAKVIPLNKNVG